MSHSNALSLFRRKTFIVENLDLLSGEKKKFFFSSPLLSPPLTSIRERIEFNLLLGTINRRTNYIPPSPPLPPPLFIGDAILKSGRVLFEVKAGYSIISARMYRDGGGEGEEGRKEEEEEEGTVCAYARS